MQKLEPIKLNDQIAQRIIDMIVDGEVGPGSRLPPERALAATLGVSRGSLRQTLVGLEVEGILDIRAGSGVFVASDGLSRAYSRPVSNGEAIPPLEIIEARRVIEAEAAERAAMNGTDAEMVHISNLLTDFSEGPRRYDLRHPADRGFHVAIGQMSGNRALAQMVEDLWDMQRGILYQRLEDHFSTAPMRDLAIEDHRRIVSALCKRDGPAARRAMYAHMDRIHLNLSTGALHHDAEPVDSQSA